ncbi:positive regulation of myeloid dendritic cell activation [Mactra antiquata]
MASILSTTVVLCLQYILAACSCPDGWQRHGPTCYHFSHDLESFGIADLMCKHMGGVLAEIETLQESSFLSAQVASFNNRYWIGLTDIQEEGIWKWFNTNTMLIQTNVSNWASHEPDNTNDIENCVILGGTKGLWWDHPCHEFNRYICEMLDESGNVIG